MNKEISVCTFLNSHGDITIEWDESDDLSMKKIIQDKMNLGYTFFIIEPRNILGIPLPSRKSKLDNVEDIKNMKIIIKDDQLSKFILESNRAVVNNESASSYTVSKVVTSPDDLKGKSSVAVKPMCGG